MQELLISNYLWLKAFHIIAMVCWMAGLLYLPRIFVYHAQAGNTAAISDTFKTMEYKLLRYIMNPAMIATWVIGLLMIFAFPSVFEQGWMHAKLTLVIILTAYHHMLGRWRKRFEKGENTHDHVFYRWMNEVPTVILITAVILAVVKPF